MMNARLVAMTIALCAFACVGDYDHVDRSPRPAPAPGHADGGAPDAIASWQPDPDNAAGEPDDLAGITAAHNQARAAVGVASLSWDDDLEAVARAWAQQCINVEPPSTLIDHNPGRSNDYPGYVGENIAGGVAPPTPEGAVQLWTAEQNNYDYESNTCAAGAVCGHYTQVVWAASTRLGCARSTCPDITYGNGVICNYAPGGNWGGQRPY